MGGRKMKVQSLASILCIFTLLPCTLLVAQNPEEDTSSPSLRVLEIDDTFKNFRPMANGWRIRSASAILKRIVQKHAFG